MTDRDLPEPLAHVLKTYCNVNYLADDYPVSLRRYLENPGFPARAADFRTQLARAILCHTITPAQYETLTDDDRESLEDVEQALRVFWRDLYGDEQVSGSGPA